MQEVELSEFKSRCVSLVEHVAQAQAPLRITKRGKVIAEVVSVPITSDERFIGDMAGMGKTLGDIIKPAID